MPKNKRLSGSDALAILNQGEIDVKGRMPYSSNATLLVEITHEDVKLPAIYKPQSGERPLWDFPDGLYKREVAAYILSLDLGWDLIPPTVLRFDAPYGPGSIQLFINALFEEHYFSLMNRANLKSKFIEFAIFDLVGNNTDRKSGHILIDEDGHLWGIDNGLMFHEQPKLRTVIWEFNATTLTESQLDDLERVSNNAYEIFEQYLSKSEIKAFKKRSSYLISKGALPEIETEERPYPWPLI